MTYPSMPMGCLEPDREGSEAAPDQDVTPEDELTTQRTIRCGNCQGDIASLDDVFPMNPAGSTGVYVNPGNYLHEILTLRDTWGVRVVTAPTTEHSWFSGYAWSIGECVACGLHLGWEFRGVDPETSPSRFWGLRRQAILE